MTTLVVFCLCCLEPVPEIKGPETVSVGESLILECIAEGFPDARVVWVPPPTSSVREVEGRGSAILRVDRVTSDEQGVYTCFIYTDIDEYQKTITITGVSSNRILKLPSVGFGGGFKGVSHWATVWCPLPVPILNSCCV